ncbi:MAG: hypothetical protein IT241_03690 [Bacteroidia bacterium]|nr:hypothetical protein [Bacteroidia bacterium]
MKGKRDEKQKPIAFNKNDVTIEEYRELTGHTENDKTDEEAQKTLDDLKIFCEVVYGIITRKIEKEKNGQL